MTVPDHIARVIREKAELEERLGKLLAFFQSPKFNELPAIDRSLLRSQARCMDGYAAILKERLALHGAA